MALSNHKNLNIKNNRKSLFIYKSPLLLISYKYIHIHIDCRFTVDLAKTAKAYPRKHRDSFSKEFAVHHTRFSIEAGHLSQTVDSLC